MTHPNDKYLGTEFFIISKDGFSITHRIGILEHSVNKLYPYDLTIQHGKYAIKEDLTHYFDLIKIYPASKLVRLFYG